MRIGILAGIFYSGYCPLSFHGFHFITFLLPAGLD
jgi:hypothetical protein